MKKTKLNYTIHNPNSMETTLQTVLDVMIEVNTAKVERKLKGLADNETQKERQQN